MKRFWRYITAFLVVGLLSACSPTIYPMGLAVQSPKIADDVFVMSDGARLPYKFWQSEEAPKAIILALHGMNDYSKSFLEPAKFWAKKGITTYAYDQRGFGEAPNRGLWAGTATMAEDAVVVSQLLKENYPDIPLILLGESMGGAVVLTVQNNPELKADKLVMSAPAIWGREVMPWYQRWPLAVASHTIPNVVLRPRLKIKPSDNIDMLKALGRDPLIIKGARIDTIWGLVNLMDAAYEAVPEIRQDSLILYGKREDIIPERAWTGMINRLPQGVDNKWRLVVYDQGYHMLLRDLQAELVLEDIVSYILENDTQLPSGHEVIKE